MKVTETPDVGLEHISSSYKTKNGVGICFFDPLEEVLLEFNENTRIPVYPTETCFRRFYIVKDNYETNFNTVSLKAYSNSSDYKVKTVPDKVDSIEQIPDGNVMIEFFSNYPSGIIPFYLYIESTTTSYLEAELIIELEVN